NNATDENIVYGCDDDPNMPNLEEIVYLDDDEGVDAKADMTNLDTNIFVSPTLTTRIHKDHPLEQIIRDIHSAPQTRRMTKNVTKHVEPKKVIQALQDLSWIEVMQEELLQFKLQHVWTLIGLPHGKRDIGTKWVYRNKKDERGIVIRNKARIEAIRLFLAYVSFKDFVMYQMDGLYQSHSAWYETLSTYLLDNRFQRGQIDKSLFIKRVKGLQVTQKDDGIFISQDKYTDEILKFGFSTVKTASTPMDTSNPLLKDTEAKDVKDDGIFISQDNYMDEILKKFGFSTMKTASTLMETLNPLLKDAEAEDDVVYLYRSMIKSIAQRSLMLFTYIDLMAI
ncbi:hypothetical protein Tco_1158476, partial [Tanacetum coccineum]